MKTVLKTSMLALALLASFGASASIIEIGDNADGGDTGYPGSHIAIGDNADVWYHGIAIGDGAQTTRGLSVGDSSFSTEGAAAFGSSAAAAGYASTAIGPSTLALAGAFAGGNGATARGLSSVAIGEGAYSADSASNSVVLGSQSTTNEADVVSVGNATLKRRITNVGFASADNDAVVWAQVVPAMNGVIAGLGGGATYDPATGVMTAPSYVLPMGTYDNVGDALDALAGAIGGGGTPTPNRYFKATGMNDGTDDAAATGDRSVAGGAEAEATNYGTSAYGNLSNAGGDSASAFGHQANASGDQSTALGAYASATAMDCVSIGYGSLCDQDSTVSVGEVGEERRITNVAAGSDATDAVNVGQLNVVDMKVNDTRNSLAESMNYIGDGASYNPESGVMTAPTINFMDGSTHNDISGALHNLDGRVNDLENAPPGGGPAGPAGADGDSAYQVAVNNGYTGSETDWLASLKGDKGDKGDRGEQGVPGEPGSGSSEPGQEGPAGPAGQDGVDGIDGNSAYEVAIENGFEGTEEEWLASLEGADGRDGVDGRDGKDGAGKKLNGGSNIAVSDNEDGSQTASLKDNVELSDQGTVKVGATTVNAQGVSVAGGPSMTTNGIDAGSRRISNVSNGRIEQGSMDAVNGGQIWALEQGWNDRWTEINHRVDGLEDRIDAVGAQSAAMAQMSAAGTYLPVGKVAINAGYGQYGNSKAFAVGAKVRFSERTSGSLGISASDDGKLMIGAGFSITLP